MDFRSDCDRRATLERIVPQKNLTTSCVARTIETYYRPFLTSILLGTTITPCARARDCRGGACPKQDRRGESSRKDTS